MKHETYQSTWGAPDLSIIDFVSVGSKGSIRKRISFAPTRTSTVFVLAFGDLQPDNIQIDDTVITNNGDRNKILATVVSAIDRYTAQYPTRWIVFAGSSEARNRLYRMAISAHLPELSKVFDIYGTLDYEIPLRFSPETPFKSFLIRRKKS